MTCGIIWLIIVVENNMNYIKTNNLKYMNLKYSLSVIAICIISTIFSIVMNELGIGKENTLMVFIVGVLTVTIVTKGYIFSAAAAIISVMLFNYFFTEPIHTLRISNTQDIILIVFFLTASLISSTMTSKLQCNRERKYYFKGYKIYKGLCRL